MAALSGCGSARTNVSSGWSSFPTPRSRWQSSRSGAKPVRSPTSTSRPWSLSRRSRLRSRRRSTTSTRQVRPSSDFSRNWSNLFQTSHGRDKQGTSKMLYLKNLDLINSSLQFFRGKSNKYLILLIFSLKPMKTEYSTRQLWRTLSEVE